MNSIGTPIYLLDEFHSPKGINRMWVMIVDKITESFDLPGYLNYNTYMFTQFSYDLHIHSHMLYKYRVTLNEQVIVRVIDVHSFTTPTATFEYICGVLHESS